MASGGIFVGSVYATMELQTNGFAADIARAQTQLSGFSATAKVAGATANQFALDAQAGFDRVAASALGLIKTTAAIGVAGALGIAGFVKVASGLETTSKQMDALIGNTQEAQKVFGGLYNYVLGKPIAFPDASKAASTLLGYGRTAQQILPDMKTLSTLSIVNGADLQALALVYGQVTSRGALFGQDALQLINNKIPLTNILAKKLGVSMQEAATKINGGQISAEQFTAAMDDYAKSLDISKFSNTFQNRMISMQGSIRSFALTVLGLKIDPVKGLVVETGGLFDRISQGVADASGKLKQFAPLVKGVLTFFVDNLGTVVAALGALGAAFVAAKVGSFAAGIAALIPQIGIMITSLGAGATVMEALNVAMLANPAGLIVAAFVGIAAALAFLQIKFNIFGKAFEALKPTIEVIKKAFGDLMTFLKPVGDFVGKQLSDAFKALQSIGKQLADSFKPIISAFQSILANKTVQTVLKGIGIALLAIVAAPIVVFFATMIASLTVISKVLQFVAKHFETIKKVILVTLAVAFLPLTLAIGAIVLVVKNFGKIMGFLGDVFSTVGNTIVGVARSIGGFVAGVFKGIADVVSTVFKAIATVYNATLGPVFNAIFYVIKALFTIWVTIWTGIFQVTFTIVSTIVQIIGVVLYGIAAFIFNNILTPIYNFFVSVWNGIVSVVTTVVGAIWNVIKTVFSAVYGTISSIVGAIWARVTSVFNTIAGFIGGIMSRIFGTISSVWNAVYGTVSRIASGIWQSVSGAFNNVVNAVANGMRSAYNTVTGWFKSFVDAGKNLIDGLVRGITGAKDAVVNKVKEICSGALDAVKKFFGIHSPSKLMGKMGTYIMQGFGNGIESQSSAMAKTMYQASENVASNFRPDLSATISAAATGAGTPGQFAGGNNSNVQIYGNINLANNNDESQFLTQIGLSRESVMAEKGMAP